MRFFKRAIRKIAPLAVSALMLGSSMGFAAAADLADFPQPFISANGVADVAIIVGADAKAEDTIAATDIQSALVVPLGGTTTTVAGGETKDIPLGRALNDATYGWSSNLTDSEIPSLIDGEITIQIGDVSGDYNVHEEVAFASSAQITTGLNVSTPSDDFKDDVYLFLQPDSVVYKYVFDESLKEGNYISNATTDDPVVLTILGKEVEITSATSNSITARVGEKFTLAVGESKEVNGKTLTLREVGSDGSISVDVDGESKIIGAGNTVTINGLRVKNHARIYTTAPNGVSQATIIAGSKTTKTYKSGDEFIGQDENDPDWVWYFSGLDTNSPTIEVQFDQTWDDQDEALKVGDTLMLPNDYVTVTVDSLTDGVWQDFLIEKDSTELRNSTGGTGSEVGAKVTTTSQPVLKFWADDDNANDGFTVCGKDTDTFYVYTNSSGYGAIYYWDYDASVASNNPRYCGNFSTTQTVTVKYDDTRLNLKFAPINKNLGAFKFNLTSGGDTITQSIGFTSNFTTNNFGFGTKDGSAQAGDIVVFNAPGPGSTKNIGTWEENTLTIDGIRIYDPNNFGDSNKVKFALPRDVGTDFRVNVIVTGQGSSVAKTGGTQFTKPPSATFLDTQIDTIKDRNIISVGGSAVNRVTAEILGLPYPTYGTDEAWQTATGITGEGQAIIKLVDSPYTSGKVAMIVAGWRGVDTQRAAKALYNGVPALSGQEAKLNTVTSTVTKV